MGNLISPSLQILSPTFHYEHGSNQVMDDFLKNVVKVTPIQDFLIEFRATQNYEEQIQIVKPFLKWDPPGEEYTCFFQKRDGISYQYSDILSLSCKEETFEEAEQEANLAVAFAGTVESLALAYATRSVLLHHLKDTSGALEEIERALYTTDERGETEKRVKWEELRSKYQSELDKELTDKEKEEKVSSTKEKNRRKLYCEDLFKIKCPNPKAPAMEDCLEIRWSPSRGRHLVVTKDVPIGKTLLVETPFVSGLNGTLELEQAHCHHCLKRNLQCIPCPNCVFALFCDENCLLSATPYHKYECPCFPHLRSVLTDQKYFDGVNFHLAFKLICLLGPQNLFQIFLQEKSDCKSTKSSQQQNSKTPPPETIPGCDPETGIYDSSSYTSIVHLAAEFTPEKNHFHLPLFSLILTRILDLNTNFFADLPSDQKPLFLDFIATKILQHYSGIRINVFSIWELSGPLGSYGVTIEQSKKVKLEHDVNLYARGVFPTASLMNHSCDPNLMLFPDLTRGRIAIVSVKSLKIGEEVAIFYCPPFSEQPIEQRQQRLLTGYDFHCSCVACVDEWPTMSQGLSTGKRQFCCKRCAETLFSDMKNKERMKEIGLTTENEFKCGKCGWQYYELDILNEFNKHKRALTVGLRRIQTNSPMEGLRSLRAAMEFFHKNICPPYGFGMFVQKYHIQAIQYIIHFSK